MGCGPTWMYRGLDEYQLFEGLSNNDLGKLEFDGWRDCPTKARKAYEENLAKENVKKRK